jgi:hypothetical protein
MSLPEQSIEWQAVWALFRWKSSFVDDVAEGAQRIAAETAQPGVVNLSHYRIAAIEALRKLEQAILAEGTANDGRDAA